MLELEVMGMRCRSSDTLTVGEGVKSNTASSYNLIVTRVTFLSV